METEISVVTSHIKNVRRKKVIDERINSELRRKNMLIGEKGFETAIDNLVESNKLELRGNDYNKMC